MSDSQDSRVGSMFGPYHLKRLLGRGGMGEVYEADHTVKEWTVAVKLLSETFSKDPVFRERMKREARIAGRLQEPHVVPIHDYGEIDGQLFLEMRLIEGIDLDSVLKRFGPLTPPRAVAIISQVASALDAAHAAGVMHRDVKPPNILITRDDFAYLVDFGIASATTDEKLTQLGTAVGTWKYMAPERFSSEEVTYRADIYALGCVLYECLTGAPPYRADSASVLVTAHLMDPVPQASAKRAGIPKSFDAVIAHAMAKKPEDRYASAGDLALAAHDALSNPDQDHASDILRRSREATLQGPASANPLPTMAGTGVVPPQPTPPTMAASNFTAPQPPTVQQTPPPYTAQPTWAPDSGPMPAQGQPALITNHTEPTHTEPAVLPPRHRELGQPAPGPASTADGADVLEPASAPAATTGETQPVAHHRRRRGPGAGARCGRHRHLGRHETRQHAGGDYDPHAPAHHDHHHPKFHRAQRRRAEHAAQPAARRLPRGCLQAGHPEAGQHLAAFVGHGELRAKHQCGRPDTRDLRAVRRCRRGEAGLHRRHRRGAAGELSRRGTVTGRVASLQGSERDGRPDRLRHLQEPAEPDLEQRAKADAQ